MVKEIADFEKDVARSGVPVVVDFWAEWCGPCKLLGPVFDKVAGDKALAGKVAFGKVNVDEHAELAQNAGVLNIPCVILFDKGEEVGRMVGFSGEAALRAQIDGWLKR
ncbi:thioredoxin [Candidatus Woesearchaeota archaeon]|nr:thioredoxin [Candidatus Woesearchaeota archaeon]